MKRWGLLAAAIALIVAAVPASACPLCLGGLALTPGQQLDIADSAGLDPSARAAIVAYLERYPRAEARAALASLHTAQ